MFEIKKRDIAGRIGILNVRGKKIKTPLLLPVVNINDLIISPREIYEKYGFEAIITNAYIIWRSKYKEEILEKGIHEFLDFPGVIETDSGSYQMLHYGKEVEVSNKEIIEFQKKIGVDIFNVLDIPSSIEKTHEEVEKDLEITFERIKEGIELKEDRLMNGAVQGGLYPDLREKAAKIVGNMDVDIFAIGTIVPLMINYEFKKLFEVVLSARIHLPLNKPVHLFGLGHPLIMPLSVAIGADIFDSASYALYAKDDRIITPYGTERLNNLEYLPYPCPRCSEYSVKELMSMDKRERARILAHYNLWVLKNEIEQIRNAISGEYLWELVILKAHSHYKVYEATKFVLEKYYKWLKSLDPIRKSTGLIYQGELTELRADLKRALERLKERVDPKDYEDLYEYVWPFNSLRDQGYNLP